MNAIATEQDFAALTSEHTTRLFRIGMRLTRQPAEASDLVQEALLRAWTNWDKFSNQGKLGAWLSRILVNTFISRHRHQKVVDATAARCDIQHHLFDPRRIEAAECPERDWQARGFSDEVRGALDQLSPRYREVVVLVDVEGMAYQEAADELGCPVGTVMSRLHRARRQLRTGLREYAQEFGLGMAA